MKTEYKGIDYGLGRVNIDKATGIRFGVINQHNVGQAWYDSSEAYYGPLHCPKCGNEAVDLSEAKDTINREEYETLRGYCDEFACDHCEVLLDWSAQDGAEPLSFFVDEDGLKAECSECGDIFITLSPYFTKAQFCSPCAPGAGYLTNPCDDGEKTYCFGHDWFESGVAPYPVYSVATGELELPKNKS